MEKKLPKFIKVTFFVLPHPMLGYKSFKKERLIANDFLQIRKVIEHVYEKVMGSSETGSSAGSPTGEHHHGHSQVELVPMFKNPKFNMMFKNQVNRGRNNSSCSGADDNLSIAEERVELLCNDQVLDPNFDLRTVKHFIWKSSSDLVLHYRPLR